jgi:hypothetical protein
MTDDADTPPATDERLDAPTAPGEPAHDERLTVNRSARTTDLYSDDDWRRIKDALAAYEQIKKDFRRHRDDWLKVVGPALVIVRTKAQESTGITNIKDPNYPNAIGDELKRTGLDTIDKSTRSYLLKIMDNLSEVEAWLAERPNPDRLNHPKTIWNAFDLRHGGWEDDDPDDDEEYLGTEYEEGDGETDADQEKDRGDDNDDDGDTDDGETGDDADAAGS